MNNNLLVYSLTIVIIVCCVLIIILAIKYKSSIEEERGDESTEEKPTTIGDYDGDECHTISRLMVYKRENDVWICPFCETENELTRNTCCLCQKSKG